LVDALDVGDGHGASRGRRARSPFLRSPLTVIKVVPWLRPRDRRAELTAGLAAVVAHPDVGLPAATQSRGLNARQRG